MLTILLNAKKMFFFVTNSSKHGKANYIYMNIITMH